MLSITIPKLEKWDSLKQEFTYTKEHTIQLEHSLVSIAKWESTWCKPFLSKKDKTIEETIDYIRCMTVTQNIPQDSYDYILSYKIGEINQYIDAKMSATYFSEETNKGGVGEVITSELIYYLMIAFNIPFECQKWHFNRLHTLIRICKIKNQPPKKMSKREITSRNAALNAARRSQLNSRG